MPLSADEIRKDFERVVPLYTRLKEEAFFILESSLKEAEIKYHSITGRIKTIDSILSKLERKQRVNLADIQDLVGVRVVCLFLSDIQKIGDIIKRAFDVDQEDNKVDGKDLTSFGYLSIHFIVRIKKKYMGPRYEPIRELPFEIQVRTIAMDAWAATSHYLDYKSEGDIPSELKRNFFALSGLFYVADQHFEMFFKARLRSKRTIARQLQHPQSEVQIDLNLDTLQEYLKKQFYDRDIPDAQSTSDLLTELKSAGYQTIAEIDDTIRSFRSMGLALEKDMGIEHGDTSFKLAAVGFVRGIFDIASLAFQDKRLGRFRPPWYLKLTEKYRN